MERTVLVYLAGPEVFLPSRVKVFDDMYELCRSSGLTPVGPSEADPGATGKFTAEDIYRSNIEQIRRADVVIADMTHFRGAEPDSGTCFEVGFAVATGKPCYLYCDDAATAVDRVRQFHAPVSVGPAGHPVDDTGRSIEDFGFPVNLMMAVPGTLVVGDFTEVVAKVARDLSNGTLVINR